MVSFLFRTSRLDTELVMQVGLQEIQSGKLIPGQLTTTVVNVSQVGACLILPKLDINGKHLFFATLNSDRYNLFLRPEKQLREEDDFTIPAQSLWMDSCEYESRNAFKIGVQFLQKQKGFFRQLKDTLKDRAQPT